MYKFVLFALLLFTPCIQAQTAQQSTKVSDQEKMLSLMETMKRDYERFIDTPPSSEKKALAQKVNVQTQQFEKQYPDVPQLPAVLELRQEVDIYLQTNQ